MSRITMRPASLSDAAYLHAWDQLPHIKKLYGDDEWWDWPVELACVEEWRDMYIAEHDGTAFGFLQIMRTDTDPHHYWGDLDGSNRAIDIWIGPADYLGRGFGTEMMNWAIAQCFADESVKTIWIDPHHDHLSAHRFYQRFGFQPVETKMMGETLTLVHKLDRNYA